MHLRVNPFHTTGLFLYLLKSSENLWFSDAFRGCRKKPMAWNGLNCLLISAKNVLSVKINWKWHFHKSCSLKYISKKFYLIKTFLIGFTTKNFLKFFEGYADISNNLQSAIMKSGFLDSPDTTFTVQLTCTKFQAIQQFLANLNSIFTKQLQRSFSWDFYLIPADGKNVSRKEFHFQDLLRPATARKDIFIKIMTFLTFLLIK